MGFFLAFHNTTTTTTHQVEDQKEADRLKKEGILVRTHIPIGPSNLELDKQVLETFGE